MEIKNFIKIYDEVLPWNTLSNLIRFARNTKFNEARIGGGDQVQVNFNIRKTLEFGLSNCNDLLSNVHWNNFLYFHFYKCLQLYRVEGKIIDYDLLDIFHISLLKYENTGFYTWHVDHHATNPRTMSCILLLNNDYEGGNLCFRNPDGTGEHEVEVKPNRMIIWPSNFLYPHTVKPVLKGTRYSVVAWAV